MSNLGPLLNSIWDEEAWGLDSSSRSSLYQVQSSYYSLGTVENSIDHDFYRIAVNSGYQYTITVTSDSSRYGWNTFNNSMWVEFFI
jgi:hypothetical protein